MSRYFSINFGRGLDRSTHLSYYEASLNFDPNFDPQVLLELPYGNEAQHQYCLYYLDLRNQVFHAQNIFLKSEMGLYCSESVFTSFAVRKNQNKTLNPN